MPQLVFSIYIIGVCWGTCVGVCVCACMRVCVSCDHHHYRFSSFVKSGSESYVLGGVAIKHPISDTEKVKIVISQEGKHLMF